MPMPTPPSQELPPYPSGRAKGGLLAPRLSGILWSVLLSVAMLGVVGYFTFEPDDFAQMLSRLNPWILGVAVLSVGLRVFFCTWRLHYVAGGHLDLMGALRGQIAWDFFSNITPSTIGGAPFAAAFIARDRQMSLGQTTAFMLFSMLLDQIWFALTIPLVLVAAWHIEVIPQSFGVIGTWTILLYFGVLLAWVLLFGYATFFRPQLLTKGVEWMCRFRGLRSFREKALGEMHQLMEKARVLRSQPAGFYVKGLLLTMASWMSRYVIVVLIIWSVYPPLDKTLVLLRTVAITLGSLILPTPGGAGGLEGFYALMLGPPLVPEALVMPTLITWRLLSYYIFIAIGILMTMDHVRKTIRRQKHEQARVLTEDSRTPSVSVASPEPVGHLD